MHYALVIAGGSGTRLWPTSREHLPKQLIPLIAGRSLLQVAFDRLEGLVDPQQQCLCAAAGHREAMLDQLPQLAQTNFFGEPTGRDTLNAVGLSAALLARRDADAVVAVLTADHLIEPIEQFQKVLRAGFTLAQQQPRTLVTFGITPTHPATGYGYLELGQSLQSPGAWRVQQFKEKPDLRTATDYVQQGPSRYLWNSGMFVWRARTLVDCIRQFAPINHAGLSEIADAWDTAERAQVLARVYPTLPKISVDFALMEPASRDPAWQVAVLPMPVSWMDVGSWPSLAQTMQRDDAGNAVGAARALLLDSRGNLVVSSDPDHLVATIGCEQMIIVHTPDATLVCPLARAEEVKQLAGRVKEQHPDRA